MKKTCKHIAVLLSAFAVAASCAVNVMAYSAYDIVKQLNEINNVDYTAPKNSGALYVPVRPAEGEIVNYWDWDRNEGVLIYCADADAIQDVFGDNIFAFQTKMYFLNVADAFSGDYSIAEELSGDYAAHPENLYVYGGTNRARLNAALTDERIEMLGILQVHVHQPAEFVDGALHIELSDGYAADTIDWDAISEQAGTAIAVSVENGYCWAWADNISTVNEAAALCEELEKCNEISMAWPEGVYNASEEYINLSDVKLIPFENYYPQSDDFVFGDVDGSGQIDVIDAQSALMAAAAIMTELEPKLNAQQLAISDVDGDGTVTPKDAQSLLVYAARVMSEQEVSWDVIFGTGTK